MAGLSLSSSPALAATPIACPSGPFVVVGGAEWNIDGDCTIDGNLDVSDGSLLVTNSIFTVVGNVSVAGSSTLRIEDSTLVVPNEFSLQREVVARNAARIELVNCTVVTNVLAGTRFMSLIGRDSSSIYIENCNLDTQSSWLFGAIVENANLYVTGSQSIPTEIYPIGFPTIDIVDRSEGQKVWLRFDPGASAIIQLPVQTSNYSWSFGRNTYGSRGVGYQINVDNSRAPLGLNAWSNTDIVLVGNPGGGDGPRISINLQIQGITQPEIIADIGPGYFNHLELNSGRHLELWGVRVRPFGWQIYARDNQAPIFVRDSIVNEVGVFPGGVAVVERSLMQLAAGASLGGGSVLLIRESEIHSQTLLARGDGIIVVENSEIHGSQLQATGNAKISVARALLMPNGDGTPCELPADGIVDCNPFVVSGAMPAAQTAGGGLVFLPKGYGVCTENQPAIQFDRGPPSGSVATEVLCSDGANSYHDTVAPFAYPKISTGDDGLIGSGKFQPATTYHCALDNQQGDQINMTVTTPAVCP